MWLSKLQVVWDIEQWNSVLSLAALDHMLSQQVQVSGCMMHAYTQFWAAQIHHCSCLKAKNARLKQCSILDVYPIAFMYLPSKRCICGIICWHWLEALATWRTTRKSVHEGTWCVHYLIPRGFLALAILPFKIISFSCENDVGQSSVFVQIVEVIVNLRCQRNSLMCTECRPFKSFTLRKFECSHNYLLISN